MRMKYGRCVVVGIQSIWLSLCCFAFPGDEKILDRELIENVTKGSGRQHVIVMMREYEKAAMFDAKDYIKAKDWMDETQNRIKKFTSEFGTENVGQITTFDILPGFAADVNPDGLRALAGNTDVAAIEAVIELHTCMKQGLSLVQAETVRQPSSGSGVAVAVIDTGVDYRHPALGGGQFPNAKVIGGFNFIDNTFDPLDDQGHGTSCASIVAGIDTHYRDYYGGIAPGALIYGLKVLDRNGEGDSLIMLKAWEWVLLHQNDRPDHPIMIISQSLGGGGPFRGNCDGDFELTRAGSVIASALVKNGISVFIASGNAGFPNGLSYASCLRDVISVGAVYDADLGKHPRNKHENRLQDHVTFYSNSSSYLTILAPSECVFVPTFQGGRYTDCFDGTSAATPYAAGAAALIQSYHKSTKGRFLSVKELKDLVLKTGDPVKDIKSGFTTPRINLKRAIELLGGETDTPQPSPAPTVASPQPPSANPLEDLQKLMDDAKPS